jgi:hypothetical protein
MRRPLLFLLLALLSLVALAAAEDPSPSPKRLSIGAQRRLKAAATVTYGWMWFRASLLLFFGPPLALLVWALYRDPGTPIVLRLLHARAVEVLGLAGASPEELARQLRNDARRVRRWELGVGAEGAPQGGAAAGSSGAPAAAAAEGDALRQRRPAAPAASLS